MFSKILIANRGEIAVRIIRACKEMGISTVAVYSEADKEALHVALADESFCIGPYPSDQSYMDEDKLISAALVSGAQAIHPGYGFLSENAHFAKTCRKNGIVFIGPDASLMEAIGDKTKIKQLISKTRLNPIPDTDVLDSPEDALEAAERIGYPVMLKARSGGGGKGIRLVNSPSEMNDLYYLAVSEANASFGDGGVYMEKYVYPARHIEVQIIADEFGNVVCLGERDCSIQRNHQKLLEETPSPGVSKEAREDLMQKVIEATKSIGYVGVGTMEFLLDREGNFWFMEMNVRLQVEHCVTEMLTMVDIVKWQIRVAAGVELYINQDDIRTVGHAIECRINALTPGTIRMLHVPGGPLIRFDSYLFIGDEVPPYYDSLVGKLIVYASKRSDAVRKMKAALCELLIDGIKCNIAEQLDIISDERFVDGSYDLTFMEDR
ncbi:MAG: acetyl-CoA carboxylase biotin carboxylase subunit [Lachnospiraceae bacterium]|nr:acetyl-CoA carboxylase biotin carboxylase subunit [Lachnospiraceae bacterium]